MRLKFCSILLSVVLLVGIGCAHVSPYSKKANIRGHDIVIGISSDRVHEVLGVPDSARWGTGILTNGFYWYYDDYCLCFEDKTLLTIQKKP